nr:immunoglobulin light chain junction region [Macaca mulatta]MOX74840.1 immunoglobulin light chain junction region [Macaca mulatta]MOX75150.1 immunoglobulin light chain junction region [Macaca mulatta]MOX77217.1 immunoglobulin light chain junction region [Macaca mulatta]
DYYCQSADDKSSVLF